MRRRQRGETRCRPRGLRPRVAIANAKFVAGMRVSYDFGKVHGIPRAKSRVVGTIVAVRGRHLATPAMGEWMYRVYLDEPFCDEREWDFQEDKLTEVE